MPRFFFNIRKTDGELVRDPEGTLLRSLRAARLEAVESVHDLRHQYRNDARREDLENWAIEVANASGFLWRLPFSDVPFRTVPWE